MPTIQHSGRMSRRVSTGGRTNETIDWLDRERMTNEEISLILVLADQGYSFLDAGTGYMNAGDGTPLDERTRYYRFDDPFSSDWVFLDMDGLRMEALLYGNR